MDGNDDDNRKVLGCLRVMVLFLCVLSCLAGHLRSLCWGQKEIPIGGKLQTETGQLSGTKDMPDGEVIGPLSSSAAAEG